MDKRNFLLLGLIFLALTSLCWMPAALGSSTNSVSDNVTMFRQDPAHSGYTIDNSSTNSAKLLWNYSTGRMVESSPAAAYGYVFVGSRDSSVYCLNASSGQLIWENQIRSEVWSSPAVYNMYAYVGADDGYVYCLGITDGKTLWRTQIGAPVRSSPTFADGVIYIASGNQNLYALNSTDGDVIWSFPSSTPINSSPAVSDGLVYVSSNDGCVYAVNASTGIQIWRYPVRTSEASSPAVNNGYVYIGSYDGYVYGLNASTGAQMWRYQTGDEVESSPAVAYGCVYVGSEDNNVYCLNASSGNKIWQSPTEYWVTSSPVVAEGNVYVGSQDYNIYCFNATTGAKEWSYPTGNIIVSSPAIWNNTLYIGSVDCNIYALTLYNSPPQTSILQTTTSLPWTTVAFDAAACTIGAVIIFALAFYFYINNRRKPRAESTDVSEEKKSWFNSHADVVFLLAILGLSSIFFINLGNGVLQVADEQTYSQWAYHMFKTGDYFTPWAFGSESFVISKPPLLMWLMSLAYQVFGVNNFASRIWSAGFGTLSLILVFYLGKKLYNRYVGFMSAVVLGTFITYFTFARYAMTDVPLVCFILGSIYFFVLSEEKGNSKRYAALSGLFFGLALMTKQIAALLIPIIIFAYALSTKKSLRFLFTKHFTLFWGVGLLLFSPWVIYMGVTFGSHFWQSYFLYSDVSRAISPVEGHAASYFFYFGSLVNSENWLWLVLLPFAAGLCIFNAVFKRLKADILVLLWMAIVLLVFSFVQTKIYWYIMPVYPAFALAISSLLYELSKKLLRKPHTGNKLMKRQLQKDIHFLN